MHQRTIRSAGPILHGTLSGSARSMAGRWAVPHGLQPIVFSAPSRATARAALRLLGLPLLSNPRLNPYHISDCVESAERGLTEELGGRLCIFETLIHECLQSKAGWIHMETVHRFQNDISRSTVEDRGSG